MKLHFVFMPIKTICLAIILISIFMIPLSAKCNSSKSIKSQIVMPLFQPKDLYDFLFIEEIDTTIEGYKKRILFKNKYNGNHSVGIILDNFTNRDYFLPLSQRYDLSLELEVNFYYNERILLSRTVKTTYDPFLGKRGNGFSFFTYKTPNELPIGEIMECEIIVIRPDDNLSNRYGPVKFYIQKMSDK